MNTLPGNRLIGLTVEEGLAAELRDINWRLEYVQETSDLAPSAGAELRGARNALQELIEALLHPVNGETYDVA